MERTDARELAEYRFLGWGPGPTGAGLGWAMRPQYFGRCGRCGDMLSVDAENDGECRCGGLYNDSGCGRFGSVDGDDTIAIYERLDHGRR